MNSHRLLVVLVSACVAACAGKTDRGTLAELQHVEAEVGEVQLEQGLERASQGYRRYLEETPENALTPEAMRRLADLQIEKEYGLIGDGRIVELPAPDSALVPRNEEGARQTDLPGFIESDQEFEGRTTGRQEIISEASPLAVQLPDGADEVTPAGPKEAIKTYEKILATYPNYERNDHVLYQMSRAYDEVGQTEDAMDVIERLIAKYPHSKYLDEVQFRRGEYFFVRRNFRDAEEAYSAIIKKGTKSEYYELALYKMGWALYKQDFYEEALHKYMAMLDYRVSIGYEFGQAYEEDDELRVADTFRVISLSFSNLGGPEVIDEYFSMYGHRSYANRIYSNLGEFYLSKLRYNDAASVYKSFIDLYPLHRVSPHFSMRVVEIYEIGGFPQLVVESKKEFATKYALHAEYWNHFSTDESPEVLSYLKTNLNDLANHYHALYQDDSLEENRPEIFVEALHWYREYLHSFPEDPESPPINYQLADLLLEHQDFGEAAREYEQTAYGYALHERASAAGYAAIYAHRENLKAATGARRLEVKQATVGSSLKFADTFPEHEQAAVVLGAAADDLYDMNDFHLAIESAHKVIERYPGSDPSLLRSAWVVVAHSSIDIAEYENSEHAYLRVLQLTAADDDSREAIVDGLAASIYKQGEQANLLEDYRAAANHFLRIKDVAPTSEIRAAAEYDAAAALVHLEDWSMAANVLEDFRGTFADHELHSEATKQLAFIYHEDGQLARSAAEYERIATESTDPQVSSQALLVAGELYEEALSRDSALRVYMRYVTEFPRPLDTALETRSKIASMFKAKNDQTRYYDELREIVAIDKAAGDERTDRSKYLAAQAGLVLSEQLYKRFADLKLVQPFERSLAEKQKRMDAAMGALEALVEYEVAEVTAAATFHIAEIYYNFSNSLLESERPDGLDAAEMADYELVIEEEAYPFEERAIEVHEDNFELLAMGVYNPWVQKSLEKLADLMPGRYAKNEISSGFVGSIDTYAYRMPNAPKLGVDEPEDADMSHNVEPAVSAVKTEQIALVDTDR
jgi:cellulose synthase operon protein C